MSEQKLKLSHKTPGCVRDELVRCGRPNCKCHHGRLHGPYTYHYTRVAGRMIKTYVPAAQAFAAHQMSQQRRQLRLEKRLAKTQLQSMTAFVHQVEDESTCKL